MQTDQFNFSDEEFLSVVNMICKIETPFSEEYIPIDSMEDSLNTNKLDSLGMILFFVWLAELFEIPEEATTAFIEKEVFTIQVLKDFVKENCTQTYSYVDAEEMAKQCF